jgi:hypothetical protein
MKNYRIHELLCFEELEAMFRIEKLVSNPIVADNIDDFIKQHYMKSYYSLLKRKNIILNNDFIVYKCNNKIDLYEIEVYYDSSKERKEKLNRINGR